MSENSIPFYTANILLPKSSFEKWSVIACDQYTYLPEYWNEAKRIVGDAPSALSLIFPEAYLGKGSDEEIIRLINENMKKYLRNGIYNEYKNALIYVERTQADGRIRQGLVGAIDLEAYDFSPNASCDIRATEKTVVERLPVRVEIRREASTELPHVMLLMDDPQKNVLEAFSARIKASGKKLYDFTLMQGGGKLRGYLVSNDITSELISAISKLRKKEGDMLFAVGDGNHSLAAAKLCYEQAPNELNRYALVELVNLHSDALDFEPIYRIVENIDPKQLCESFKQFLKAKGAKLNCESPEQSYTLFSADGECEIGAIAPPHPLAVGTVQLFLDEFVLSSKGANIDYIHGKEELKKLSLRDNCVGFLYDGLTKETLFESVERSGVLPRKTFSMGEAHDKRYYTEARLIRPENV